MKNNKLIIIVIVVLALVFIGVGVSFTIANNNSDNSTENKTSKKENRMNKEHTKDGVKVTSFTVVKDESNTSEAPIYKVTVNIVNDTGKDIVSGKIDFRLLCESGEKREYTAFISELESGKSVEYSKSTTFDVTDFYDYEMEVTVSDKLEPMGY